MRYFGKRLFQPASDVEPRWYGLFLTVIACWLFTHDLLQPVAHAGQGFETDNQKNIALGAKYSLWPRPNYIHCTDPHDKIQLTDGQSTKAYFWTQKGTVGWRLAQWATVTVDLGRVQPIGGAALTTAAGTAGVTWPQAVYVLVSKDGKQFHLVANLVECYLQKFGDWPKGYAIVRLACHQLNTAGRFVQFVLIPPPGGPYLFTDEIEIYAGDESLLHQPVKGQLVSGPEELSRQTRIVSAVRRRLLDDLATLRDVIGVSSIEESEKEQLLAEAGRLESSAKAYQPRIDKQFRAVLPMGPVHRQIFALQARLWRLRGWPTLLGWTDCHWDPLPLFLPEKPEAPHVLTVHCMLGEYRAAAFNLAWAGRQACKARIYFQGLPGSPCPSVVTVHDVVWTDTIRCRPVAAALPLAEKTSDGWYVSLVPGLPKQVWLTFHPTDIEPREYLGRIVIETENTEASGKVVIDVRLVVWPFRFPEHTTLWLGGWSYLDRPNSYGITPANKQAVLKHLREHFVNAPWATAGVMFDFEVVSEDPLRLKINTEPFDQWRQMWPNAAAYLVFLSVPESFAGRRIGTPEFDRLVGVWIKAWVEHLKQSGIRPEQLGLLLRDEPHEGKDLTPLLAWARAIKKAAPDVLIWEDPTFRRPWEAPPELFRLCDVLCPNRPMWLGSQPDFADFYLRQRRAGKQLQFYSCSGPAKLLDPYSYYRLQAWHCWQVGGTGSFFWAFGDNGGASSWVEYLARGGPYTPFFLDSTSVVAGKHMEAIRESVEDYEYFVMLSRVAQQARNKWPTCPLLDEAEQLLDAAAERVLSAAGASSIEWHKPKDRTVADAIRVELLQMLYRLSHARKQPG